MLGFRRFAWTVLAYNLAVILWGAVVRATGSGAGCGEHWPLCNGEVLPRTDRLETAIEFTHRAMSGIALLLVFALVIWAIRTLPGGHAGRRAAVASGVLIVTEALVGAGLVLFGWVAGDTSIMRGWVVAIHLANTFLLLAALALAVAFAERPEGFTLGGRGPIVAAFGLGFATLIVTGATGAIAALGDTLYPAARFSEGLRQELASGAPPLLRLRAIHPFAAVASAIVLVGCARAALRARPQGRVRTLAFGLLALVALQLVAGAANLALLAPVWLQLLHLALAELTWIALILLSAELLAPGERAAGPELPVGGAAVRLP